MSSQFLILNGLATIIATYGLLANSTAVVIGAMLIAVLLGPIMGLALSLVDNNFKLFVRSIVAEAIGVVVVLSLATLIARIHGGLPITEEIVSRTHPNLLDLVIALAGGAAGAYATVNPKINGGLVGVAIATALVPPLSAAGICLAKGNLQFAAGAMLLFATNLIAIQISASIVLAWMGYHRIFDSRKFDIRVLRVALVDVVLLLALGAFLSIQLSKSVERQRFEDRVRNVLKRGVSALPGAVLADAIVRYDRNRVVVVALVRTPFSITPENTAVLEGALPEFRGLNPRLHVRSQITKETTSEGYLHEIDPNSEPVEDSEALGQSSDFDRVGPNSTMGQP